MEMGKAIDNHKSGKVFNISFSKIQKNMVSQMFYHCKFKLQENFQQQYRLVFQTYVNYFSVSYINSYGPNFFILKQLVSALNSFSKVQNNMVSQMFYYRKF